MRFLSVHGVIARRLLINYRAAPDVVQALLPAPFRPKLHRDQAVVGICLIRLEGIRPAPLPAVVGVSSENAAHRIAVVWEEGSRRREGVYIVRRDTGSLLNHVAGGRLFPGEHHRATFRVEDDGNRVALAMRAADAAVAVDVEGHATTAWPQTSLFENVAAASAFFEPGSVGYSPTAAGGRLDGVALETRTWSVEPFAIDRVQSSIFDDRSRFPDGSITLDCGLVMRDIAHEWRAEAPMAG